MIFEIQASCGFGNRVIDPRAKKFMVGKAFNFLLMAVLIIAILVPSVEAAGTPTRLNVFTDRQVYTDGAYNGQKQIPAVLGKEASPYNLTVYAILLDDDGNIINSGIEFQAYYNTTAILDHVNESETPANSTYAKKHHIVRYGDLFNGTFSSFSETSNRGVFYSSHAPLDIPNDKYPDEHFMINITVKATYKSKTLVSNYTIMLTRLSCHNNAGNPTDEKYAHNSQHNNKPDTCAICHHGYEHMYENISEGIPNSFRASHFGKIVPTNPTTSSPQASTYFWNLSFSTVNTIYSAYTPSSYQWGTWAPGSQYCYDCHYDTTSGTYGGATSPGYIDMQSSSGDRVSCSWSSSPSGAICHSATKIEKNSTASLLWKYIANAGGVPTVEQAVQSKSHNHSNVSQGRACKLCHRDYHANVMPNGTASRTSIKEQCWLCHSVTGPQTSSKFAHSSSTTNCKQCHKNASGVLDVHLVPEGVAGGVNCTNCHNIGRSASNVNFTAVNKSMHANLNKNASFIGGNATNKPCWACHGTKNGTWANQSDQPVDSHNKTVYKNPRKCEACHNDTWQQFTAKNVTDHIPSGLSANTDVNTSSYNNTYCSYCHNNSVGASFDPDGLGLAGGSPRNASVSHYGANKTKLMLMNATSNSTDCNYCHKNGSNMAKWGILQGSLANISNKNATGGGTNHNSYTASSQCAVCHGSYTITAGFTFHNSSIGSGSRGGSDCKLCHDIGGTAGAGRLVNFSAMNNTSAIHKNLNSGATTALPAENKKCWACHGNGSDPGNKHPSNYKNPYDCEDCHVPAAGQNLNFTPKTILNVSQHYWNGTNITTIITFCNSCHNKTEMLVGINLDPDGGEASNNSGHYGKKRTDIYTENETNCSYCHQGTSEFNDVFQKSSNTQITHDNGKRCYLCHRSVGSLDGRIHDSSLVSGGGEDCIACHVPGDVNTSKFARHASINTSDGPGNVSNNDCWTCHYLKDMNRSHVYLCDSCHKNSSGIVKVNDPALIVGTLKHASNTCKSCHAPDTYHVQGTVGPSGRVENPGWELISAIDNTGCHDCHRTHNGLNEPFHGPGIGSPGDRHIATNSKNNGSDCSSTCHTSNTNPHDVKSATNTQKPNLSTPVLSPSTGNSVEVIATGSSESKSASLQIEAAQYRIYSSIGQMIVDWTAMNAKDGRFNSSLETVNATINTTGFPEGTYNVSVRVMASGPRTNTAIRYYPLNGDWSTPLNATLVIEPPKGYVNGTVNDSYSGSGIPGVTVTTNTGVSANTDSTGFYSLGLLSGTYNMTATRAPEYNPNITILPVTVTAPTTVTRDIILTKKPTGTISGVVTN